MKSFLGFIVGLFVFVIIVFLVIPPKHQEESNNGNDIFVSIIPQAYFVERIGGEFVNVNVMVGPGQNPATYEPTPRQMTNLSNAQIYFRIGVPFELIWIDRIQANNPSLRIVDLRQGIPMREIEAHHHHDKEQDEDHSADKTKDPHIWLSPPLVKIQAQTICDTLKEIDPDHASLYEDNLNDFIKDLETLNQEIKSAFQSLQNREFMVFHPAWGYFADTYGLKQVPIELEGKEPTAKQLNEFIEYAKEHNVKFIFVQEQFNQSNAQKIAEAIGGTVISMDPLAKDYLDNMNKITSSITQALD